MTYLSPVTHSVASLRDSRRAVSHSRTKMTNKSRSCTRLSKSTFKLRAVSEEGKVAEARPVYPFTAIIGQEEMKFAALMNIIDPNIGGIMVMGDRGTGKSTTVRSLVDLLPLIDVVKDDAFMSSPTDPNLMSPEVLATYRAGGQLETTKVPINMVDLPLGATEDRVCGTIDIEKALTGTCSINLTAPCIHSSC